MINVCLCDDDETTLAKTIYILKALALKHEININITTYHSAELLLFSIYEKISEIDIIYMDINMNKINGIEAAYKLRELGYESVIIYLTNVTNYVFQSFDTNPLNYIIKSEMNTSKFEDVFLKAVKISTDYKKRFFICKNSSEFIKIPLHNICYFEIRNRIVTMHYIDKQNKVHSFDFYSKISNIMDTLSKYDFTRVHRSFLVNQSFVSSIKNNSLELFTGEILPIGKTYLKSIKELFSSSLSSDYIGLE